MDNKLYVVVSPEDLEAVKAIQSDFEAKDISLEIQVLPLAGESIFNPVEMSNCLLWLTAKTGEDVYMVSKNRREKGLPTVNILPERFVFSQDQKTMVGRNPSVILALTRGDIVVAIVNRVGGDIVKKMEERLAAESTKPQPGTGAISQTPGQSVLPQWEMSVNASKAQDISATQVKDATTATSSVSDTQSGIASIVSSSTTKSEPNNTPRPMMSVKSTEANSVNMVRLTENEGNNANKEEYDSTGYQFTAIIIYLIILFINYTIFGGIRSDSIFFYLQCLVEGAAALFCLLMAWMGFTSKKFWPFVKSIACGIVGLWGIWVALTGFVRIGDLF